MMVGTQRSWTFVSRLVMFLLLFALLHASARPIPVSAASFDTDADRVLGEPNFTAVTGGLSASLTGTVSAVAIDLPSGRIFVCDYDNNRVLSWPSATGFTNGQAADIVIGQQNFTTNSAPSPPTAFSLNHPIGLAIGPGPTLYVVDGQNNRVLGYSSPFTIGMAAKRVLGQADFVSKLPNRGLVTPNASTLNGPFNAAFDPDGNLFVSDKVNHRVLRYDAPFSDGMSASLVLGQGSFTTHTSAVTRSGFDSPTGVAVDSSGNAYVAEQDNNRLLVFNAPLSSGMNATAVLGQVNFASGLPNEGAAAPTSQSLYDPQAISLDVNRNLYVADYYNNRVLRYTPGPDFTNHQAAAQVFGQLGLFTTNGPYQPNPPGTPTRSNLSFPMGVATDASRNLYIADFADHRVLAFDLPVNNPAPVLASLFPNTVAAGGTDFMLTVIGNGFTPSSVVRVNSVDRTTIYVSPGVIKAPILASDIAAPGISIPIVVTTPAPGGGTSAAVNLTTYAAIAGDLIADGVLSQPDFTSNSSNNGGISARGTAGSTGVTVDPTTGRLFLADYGNSRVLSWPNAAMFINGTSADIVLGQASFLSDAGNQGLFSSGALTNSLSAPLDVAVAPSGHLAVADTYNNRVLLFSPPFTTNMAASTVLGQNSFLTLSPNQGGATPSASTLYTPYGVMWDASGNLYVADSGNNRVLRFEAPFTNGMAASAVLGQPGFTTDNPNNGGLSATSLNLPYRTLLDTENRLYVSDNLNNRVLIYDLPLTNGKAASGVIGQSDFTTSAAPTPPTAASLGNPIGLAIDDLNNLYVADNINNRVLIYPPPRTNGMAARTVLGQPDFTTNASGATNARLAGPFGLDVDVQRNLYTTDFGNYRLLRFNTPIPNPPPGPITISPATVIAGSPAFTMTVSGSGFVAGSQARWQGIARTTTYISPTMLTVLIPVNDIVSAGVYSVTVSNPVPGGGTSPALPFTVTNPVPQITSYSPSQIFANQGAFAMIITGTGFVAGTVVLWNGSPRPTTVLSATRLQVQIGASDVLTPGTNILTAFNGGPGGGTSGQSSVSVSAITTFIGVTFQGTSQ